MCNNNEIKIETNINAPRCLFCLSLLFGSQMNVVLLSLSVDDVCAAAVVCCEAVVLLPESKQALLLIGWARVFLAVGCF